MQNHQEIDIIAAMLATVRDEVGPLLTPDVERSIDGKLRIMWGGQDVYIAKFKKEVDVQARALDIRKRYNMCNRRELQAEYGLSRTHFYKILKGG
jgi:Mor family transcriptional regulator